MRRAGVKASKGQGYGMMKESFSKVCDFRHQKSCGVCEILNKVGNRVAAQCLKIE